MPAPRPQIPEPPAAVAVPLPAPSPEAFADTTPASAAAPAPAVREAALMTAAPVAGDVPLMKEIVARLKKGDLSGATAVGDQLRDPAARTVAEWLAIRWNSRQIGFGRIAAFLRQNPNWPASDLIRRRAEEALWLENVDAGTVRAFFARSQPTCGMGQLALARALGGRGSEAARLVHAAWRHDDLTPDVERDALRQFGSMLSGEDHALRAERFFYEDDVTAGLRNGQRAGSAYYALAKARAAIIRRAANADSALAAVPSSMRKTDGYRFAVINRLLRKDEDRDAAKVMLTVNRSPAALIDTHAWWEKRRWLARDMLDRGENRTAYRIAANFTATSPRDAADAEFHAGWIALRFLDDPATARKHFEALKRIASTPLTQSRAEYWLGRSEEAARNIQAAGAHYQAAARYSTTYYGQLARAKIQAGPIVLATPVVGAAARAAFARNPAVRAIQYLYAAGDRDDAVPLFKAMADETRDPQIISLLSQLASQNHDPRSALLVGKTGFNNGLPVEALAWPTSGIPHYKSVGPSVEPALVHAIARQESGFHPGAVSSAGARGLLQMLPSTAAKTARAVGVSFKADRLTSDPSYNAMLGAAHLGELVSDYGGSYILTFVAYNAGPKRAAEWVQRYGDPRDPKVDPVDWVERIPFNETRNYVQRVMENVQVYRARLNTRAPRNIEADLRQGGG